MPPPRASLVEDAGIQHPRIELEYPTERLAIVHLVGDHDLSMYEPLKEALEMAAARRRSVFIECSRCSFIDSTVISLLLHAQGMVVSGGGHFVLVIPDDAGPVRRVAEVMGLGQMFPLCGSLPSLAAGLASTPS
jgi:anti-anti-sigma factor